MNKNSFGWIILLFVSCLNVTLGERITWSENGHQYELVIQNNISWLEAKTLAEARGGYLATSTTSQENLFVAAVAADPAAWNVFGTGAWGGPWIGGFQTSDDGSQAAENWTWITGEAFTFTAWAEGEPNNLGDQRELSYLSAAGGMASTWDDASGKRNSFIVEYDDSPYLIKSSVSPIAPLVGQSISISSYWADANPGDFITGNQFRVRKGDGPYGAALDMKFVIGSGSPPRFVNSAPFSFDENGTYTLQFTANNASWQGEAVVSVLPFKIYSGMVQESGTAKPGVKVELYQDGAVYRSAVTDTKGRFTMNIPHPLPAGDYDLVPLGTAQTFFSPKRMAANYSTSFHHFDFSAIEALGGDSLAVEIQSSLGSSIVEGDETTVTVAASGLTDQGAQIEDATFLAVESTSGATISIPLSFTDNSLVLKARVTLATGTWTLTSTLNVLSGGDNYRESNTFVLTVAEPVGLPDLERANPVSKGDLSLRVASGGRLFTSGTNTGFFIFGGEELIGELLVPDGIASPENLVLRFKELDGTGSNDFIVILNKVSDQGGFAHEVPKSILYSGIPSLPEEAYGGIYRTEWSWQTSEALVTGNFGPYILPASSFTMEWVGTVVNNVVRPGVDDRKAGPGQMHRLRFRLTGGNGTPVSDWDYSSWIVTENEGDRKALDAKISTYDAAQGLYDVEITYPTSSKMGPVGIKNIEFTVFNKGSEQRKYYTLDWTPEVSTGIDELENFITALEREFSAAVNELGVIVVENDRSLQQGLSRFKPTVPGSEAISLVDAFATSLNPLLDFELGYVDDFASPEFQAAMGVYGKSFFGNIGSVTKVTNLLGAASLVLDTFPANVEDRSNLLKSRVNSVIEPAFLATLQNYSETLRYAARAGFSELEKPQRDEIKKALKIYTRRVSNLRQSLLVSSIAMQERISWAAAESIKHRAYSNGAHAPGIIMGLGNGRVPGLRALTPANQLVVAGYDFIFGTWADRVTDEDQAMLQMMAASNDFTYARQVVELVTEMADLKVDLLEVLEGKQTSPTWKDDISVNIQGAIPSFDGLGRLKTLYTPVLLTNNSPEDMTIWFEYTRAFGSDNLTVLDFGLFRISADPLRQISGVTDRQYMVLNSGSTVSENGTQLEQTISVPAGQTIRRYLPHVNRLALQNFPDSLRNFELKEDAEGNKTMTAAIKLAVRPSGSQRPWVDLPDIDGDDESQTFLSSWTFGGGGVPAGADRASKPLKRFAEPIDLMVTREIRASGLGRYVIYRIKNTNSDPVAVNWRQPYPNHRPFSGDIEGATFAPGHAVGTLALQPGEFQWLWFTVSGSEAMLDLESIEILNSSGSYIDYFASSQEVSMTSSYPLVATFGAPDNIDAGEEMSGTVTIRTMDTTEGEFELLFERRSGEGLWVLLSSEEVNIPDFGSDTFAVTDTDVPQSQQTVAYRASIRYGEETVFEQYHTVEIFSDADEDGMDDFWEEENGLNASVNEAADDPDNDGLVNLDEFRNSTDPKLADTDGDGLVDGPEVHTYLTSPLVKDSDFGGMNDGEEISSALNPLDSSDDLIQLNLSIPETVIDEQNRLFLTWSPSHLEGITEYRLQIAESFAELEGAEVSVTSESFLQILDLQLKKDRTYHVKLEAYADNQLVSATITEIEVGSMPTLSVERLSRTEISVTASGTNGFYELMFSEDLTSWDRVEVIEIKDGTGTLVIELDQDVLREGYFRLVHRF